MWRNLKKMKFVVVYMIYSVEGLAASELMLGEESHFFNVWGENNGLQYL